MKRFDIEFNGYDYVVLEHGQVLIAFESIDEAYNAKRDFEEKAPWSSEDLKIPPAMRWAKEQLYAVGA